MNKDKEYQVVNGTAYHVETPPDVIRILENARISDDINPDPKNRVRVHYGDIKTGQCWNEEWDIDGYIGRSTGNIQIPLLVHNRRSLGGPGLLDHCIIRITTTQAPRRVLYEHPNYQAPAVVCDPVKGVLVNGESYAPLEFGESARRLARKLINPAIKKDQS